LWRAHEHRGDFEAAAKALSTALRTLGHHEIADLIDRAVPERGYGAASEAAADALLARGSAPLPLECVAWLYLANDRRERALEIVEKAFQQRMPTIVWLAAAPDWEPLRDEPRFHEVVEAVGLPVAARRDG
jgi:hypothetical protein